jgi:hypothetical protein
MSRTIGTRLAEVLGIPLDGLVSLELRIHVNEPVTVKTERLADVEDPDSLIEVFRGILVFKDNG